MSNNNLSTVLAYYEAINDNNPELAAKKLSDNVRLISPLDEVNGKSNVLNAIKGFCTAIENISIRAKFSENNQVMLAYDIYFPEPIGHLRAAGLLTVNQGVIECIELFYDGQAVSSKKEAIFSS